MRDVTSPTYMEDRIADQENELTRLRRENKILTKKAAAVERLPFCPDHRDKVAGRSCRECEIERLRRERDQLRDLIRQSRLYVRSFCETHGWDRRDEQLMDKIDEALNTGGWASHDWPQGLDDKPRPLPCQRCGVLSDDPGAGAPCSRATTPEEAPE